MKKLSDTLTELGIDFSFPIEIEDDDGNQTYYEGSKGYWERYEYDANDNVTYREDSGGNWERYERESNGGETYYENNEGYKRGTPKSANQ